MILINQISIIIIIAIIGITNVYGYDTDVQKYDDSWIWITSITFCLSGLLLNAFCLIILGNDGNNMQGKLYKYFLSFVTVQFIANICQLIILFSLPENNN